MVVRGQWSASRLPRFLAYKLDAQFVRHIHPTTVEWSCHPKQQQQARALRRPPPRPRPSDLGTRSAGGKGGRATPSTSTRCWSRCTPTLVYRARPCPSWTRSSTICSRGSPPSLPVWPTTTRGRPSPAEKSRPPSVCFCPVSWPSTLWVRAPRPSPSTPAASKLPVKFACYINGSFQSHHILIEHVNSSTLCIVTQSKLRLGQYILYTCFEDLFTDTARIPSCISLFNKEWILIARNRL